MSEKKEQQQIKFGRGRPRKGEVRPPKPQRPPRPRDPNKFIETDSIKDIVQKPISDNNFSLRTAEASGNPMSEIIKQTRRWFRMPKVKSDEELLDRLDLYFAECEKQGLRPIWEEVCLAAGYTPTGFFNITTGQSPGFTSETKNIINSAKYAIATIDAKLVSENKLNPVTYIYRSKNFYNMHDRVDYVEVSDDNSHKSAEDIAKIIEDDFVE